MAEPEIAVVVGVGPGLGAALARRFVQAGMAVALAARRLDKLTPLATELGHGAHAYGCDATDEGQVESLFATVTAELGTPSLVVYNASAFLRKSILETSLEEFERSWRVTCRGGFLVGRAAARLMARRIEAGGPGGTILFTGATASLRGGAMFHNFAVGKFGLRALAQSMARELQPKGIHVAHVVIDGQIAGERPGYRREERGADALLEPAAIAESYYQLHRQQRSAWTFELDLRPWVEKF
ncbi:MAG TPA: SDR family NAD(P)-dependent oxidoreductase [Alphaproteobacteria bacterium]|nr:SDR family NAD(P)-dependent oxidoreductase [Alphaproteobacteria bacterium]